MDTNILPPSDRVSHLIIQGALAELGDVSADRDLWKELAVTALAQLHRTSVQLTRASRTVQALQRELQRVTSTQIRRAA